MSSSPSLSVVLQQLVYQAPALMVCLVGLTLGVVNLGRHPRAAALVLGGCGILLLRTVVVTIVMALFVAQEATGEIVTAVSALGVVAHAIGLALLVAAAFAGRNARPMEDAERR